MNRKELESYISDKYSIEPEYPWAKMPTFAVFRHSDNKKWFAVNMTITKDKLGLDNTKNIDVVNLKCDPLLMGSVLNEWGIFPAYHMNKTHWISVLLDGSVTMEELKFLICESYSIIDKKNKKVGK